jgi:hypothetical protein
MFADPTMGAPVAEAITGPEPDTVAETADGGMSARVTDKALMRLTSRRSRGGVDQCSHTGRDGCLNVAENARAGRGLGRRSASAEHGHERVDLERSLSGDIQVRRGGYLGLERRRKFRDAVDGSGNRAEDGSVGLDGDVDRSEDARAEGGLCADVRLAAPVEGRDGGRPESSLSVD